ncbi:hypothetical protein FRZ00_07870 [Streptomyces mobaraensis]|uniref:Uncharacterized protein n=1 Tax=Streptomyces mobaraensis TaxID=35621 RepID=A0A5N5WBN0_STRMB|nr:hypothetical protein FRZ00_07870 [Streptomyces mobaraensis]
MYSGRRVPQPTRPRAADSLGQRSAVSGQRSAVSGQRSAVSGSAGSRPTGSWPLARPSSGSPAPGAPRSPPPGGRASR